MVLGGCQLLMSEVPLFKPHALLHVFTLSAQQVGRWPRGGGHGLPRRTRSTWKAWNGMVQLTRKPLPASSSPGTPVRCRTLSLSLTHFSFPHTLSLTSTPFFSLTPSLAVTATYDPWPIPAKDAWSFYITMSAYVGSSKNLKDLEAFLIPASPRPAPGRGREARERGERERERRGSTRPAPSTRP